MFRAVRSSISVDDSSTPLGRLQKLTRGKSPVQRVVAVKELVNIAYELGFRLAVAQVLPLVRTLAADSDSIVRRALLEIVGSLAAFFILSDPVAGYQYVLELVKLVGRLLATDMDFAADAFLQLAPQLHAEDRGDIALLPVLRLAQDIEPQKRQLSARMITYLSQALPYELKETICAVQLVALADDAEASVRIAVVKQVSEFTVGLQCSLIKQRIIPCYRALCNDLVYQVRRAACEHLHAVALSCGAENVPLEDMIGRFLGDDNVFVKLAARQQIGYCLGILRMKSESLLYEYMAICIFSQGETSTEESYHCAYTFSEICCRVGAEYWVHILKPSLSSLAKSSDVAVRKTLAASLHRVAKTMGNDADAELYPFFQQFAHDPYHEVVGALVAHLGEFIVHVKARARYLQFLQPILGVDYWRLREILAKQLGLLVIDDDTTWAHVLPTWLHLCKDDCFVVRKTSIAQSSAIFHAICKDEQSNRTRRLVTHLIDEFSKSPHWQKRCTFIKIVHNLLRPFKPWVIASFTPPLARLAADTVAGVRITWAQCLGHQIKAHGRLGTQEVLVECGHALKNDATPEIKRLMSTVDLGSVFTSCGEEVEPLRDKQGDPLSFFLDVAPASTPRSVHSVNLARIDVDSPFHNEGSPPGSPQSSNSPRHSIPDLLLDCAVGSISGNQLEGTGLTAAQIAAAEFADIGVLPTDTEVTLDPEFTRAAMQKMLNLAMGDKWSEDPVSCSPSESSLYDIRNEVPSEMKSARNEVPNEMKFAINEVPSEVKSPLESLPLGESKAFLPNALDLRLPDTLPASNFTSDEDAEAIPKDAEACPHSMSATSSLPVLPWRNFTSTDSYGKEELNEKAFAQRLKNTQGSWRV